MRYISCALFTAVVFATMQVSQPAAAQPTAPLGPCQTALGALAAQWQAISFEPPSKPAQMIVAGRNGYVTTGGQYNVMTSHIRAAHLACERGDGEAAMQHISAVHEILDHAIHHEG